MRAGGTSRALRFHGPTHTGPGCVVQVRPQPICHSGRIAGVRPACGQDIIWIVVHRHRMGNLRSVVKVSTAPEALTGAGASSTATRCGWWATDLWTDRAGPDPLTKEWVRVA